MSADKWNKQPFISLFIFYHGVLVRRACFVPGFLIILHFKRKKKGKDQESFKIVQSEYILEQSFSVKLENITEKLQNADHVSR